MTVQEYNEQQQAYDNAICEMIVIDELTASKCRQVTAKALRKPVTELFFCQLAALCYYLGAEDFSRSTVLHMIHEGYSWEDIHNEHERALLIVQKYPKHFISGLWCQSN